MIMCSRSHVLNISGALQEAVKNMGWLVGADGRINASVNKAISG